MELEADIKRRLFALHPDMRLRIEDKMNYDSSFNPAWEIFYSEKAIELFNELRGESEIYFWTLKKSADKIQSDCLRGPEVGLLLGSELNHIGELALAYVRNPMSVKDIPMYRDTMDTATENVVD